MFFNQYPYLNLNDLNLDYILKEILKMREDLRDFINVNTIKYANPIQWDITRQYVTNTIVIEPLSGTAYLSTRPVPSGVDITDTDYWTPVFTLDIIASNHNITVHDEGVGIIASQNFDMGDWVLLNNALYIVKSPIQEGNAFVYEGENANVIRTTVEQENEVVYYAQDKRLTIHGKIDDYSQIVVGGDIHRYLPRIKAIEIIKAE